MGVGNLRCGARSCRRRLQVAQQLQMMEVSPNTLGFLGRRLSTVPVTETQRSHYQRVVHSETRCRSFTLLWRIHHALTGTVDGGVGVSGRINGGWYGCVILCISSNGGWGDEDH